MGKTALRESTTVFIPTLRASFLEFDRPCHANTRMRAEARLVSRRMQVAISWDRDVKRSQAPP